MDDSLDHWFDKRFPPLSIYYGGRDFLVLVEPLLDRLKNRDTDVEVIRVEKLDLSEVRLGTELRSEGKLIGVICSIVISTGPRKLSNGCTSR